MKCRNCSADNPDDAVLCAKCGATLPTSSTGSREPSILTRLVGAESIVFVFMGIHFGILGIILPLAYLSGDSSVQFASFFFWLIGLIAIRAAYWLLE